METLLRRWLAGDGGGQSGRRDGWCGVEAEWEVEEKLSTKADQGMEKEEMKGKNHAKSCR